MLQSSSSDEAAPSSSSSSSSSSTEDTAKSAASSTIVRFKRSVGRRNFKFEKVDNVFRPYDQDYRESMWMLSFPGFGLAALTLIVGLVFLILRSKDKCGGKSPSPRGYTGLQRNIPRLIILVGFVIVLGCSGLGYVGNVGTRVALRDFFDEILLGVTSTTTLTDEVVGILARAERLANTSTANSTSRYDALLAEAEETRQVTDDIKAEMLTYDDARFVIINILLAAALLSAALALYCALCHGTGISATTSIVVGTAALVLLWTSFAVHLPTSIMLADLCPAIDEFVASPDAVRSPSISVWVQCFQDDAFTDIFTISEDGLASSLDDLNAFSNATGLGPAVSFNRTAVNTTTTAGGGGNGTSATAGGGGNGTSATAGSDGSPTNTTTTSGGLITQVPSIDLQLLEYEARLLELLDAGQITDVEAYYEPLSVARLYSRTLRKANDLRECVVARESFGRVKSTLCVDMLTSLDFVLGSTGMIASSLLFVVWMVVLGKKRFDPRNSSRGDLSGGAAAAIPLEDPADDLEAAGGRRDRSRRSGGRTRKPPARSSQYAEMDTATTESGGANAAPWAAGGAAALGAESRNPRSRDRARRSAKVAPSPDHSVPGTGSHAHGSRGGYGEHSFAPAHQWPAGPSASSSWDDASTAHGSRAPHQF